MRPRPGEQRARRAAARRISGWAVPSRDRSGLGHPGWPRRAAGSPAAAADWPWAAARWPAARWAAALMAGTPGRPMPGPVGRPAVSGKPPWEEDDVPAAPAPTPAPPAPEPGRSGGRFLLPGRGLGGSLAGTRPGRPGWPAAVPAGADPGSDNPASGRFQPGERIQEQPESGWLEPGQAQRPGRSRRTPRLPRGSTRRRWRSNGTTGINEPRAQNPRRPGRRSRARGPPAQARRPRLHWCRPSGSGHSRRRRRPRQLPGPGHSGLRRRPGQLPGPGGIGPAAPAPEPPAQRPLAPATGT